LAAAAGDGQTRAQALTWLGAARRRQEAPTAGPLLEAGFAAHVAQADPAGAAWARANQAALAGQLGDLAGAVRLAEDALARYRALGNARLTGMAAAVLAAFLAEGGGEHERVLGLLEESLDGLLATGERIYLVSALLSVAEAAAGLQQPLRAARLLGAVDSARTIAGAALAPNNRADYDRVLRRLRGRVRPRALAQALAEGRAMGPEEAMAELRALIQQADQASVRMPDKAFTSAPADQATSMPTPPRTGGPAELLTPREREVARLVAGGYTNRQIAEALVITEGTAALHVAHILARLNLRSRHQVADWAVQHGSAHKPSG
jgi:non-specific serine/threonine protein kinase